MIVSVFLPLAVGFAIGMAIKRKPKAYLFWVALLILLFFVGYQTGSAVSSLSALYGVLRSALVVAFFAILGSVVVTIFVWRRISR